MKRGYVWDDAHQAEAAAVRSFSARTMRIVMRSMAVINNHRVAVWIKVLRVRHRNIQRHSRIANHGGEQYA